MSRCFPFPPPGYEKKATTDDLYSLKKEKQKEKKHKKEKKDKEKREGKDKSDGKHREKKDKKEKNRDKKDKDRDRDKSKSSNSDGKKIPGHSEGHDREKISTEKRFPGQSESHGRDIVSNEKRSAGRSEDHNGERVSNEKRLPLQFESHSGEKIIPKEKDKCFPNERRSAGQFADYNGEKVSRSIPLAEDSQDSKFAQELDRRVREESKRTANHFVDKFTGSDQKREEGMLNPVGMVTTNGARVHDKKENKGDEKKIDGQGFGCDTRFSGNSMVENFTGVLETRVEGTTRPLEASVSRKLEGKEKTKEKGGDDKRRDKRKDRDKEKKSKGRESKDRDRDKERKKEEKKAKEKKENKTLKQDQVKEIIMNDIVGTHDVKVPYLSEDSNTNAASEANLRKRKDTETNGFLHANESGPNKLPRPALSSHSLSKNGRISDPCETLIPINSDRQSAATNLKVEDRKVNGTTEAQLASLTKPPMTSVDPNVEASKRPPHPDSKYLSQILLVPKMEEFSDLNEQDWLFSRSDSLSRKSKSESSRDDKTPMVWSEALRIESADVYALPYVIPY